LGLARLMGETHLALSTQHSKARDDLRRVRPAAE
jgi:hypothetical protein